jgi:hypothetical protein
MLNYWKHPAQQNLTFFSMTHQYSEIFIEQTVRDAIWTEVFHIVTHFFPGLPIGVGDLYREDNGSWTASIYMVSNGVRETYELGALFCDPLNLDDFDFLGSLAIEAKGAADRAVAAIDDSLAFVAESNKRIDAMGGRE